MASVVETCNFALSYIRAGSINSLTEASLQAQQCSLHFDILRDLLLTDVPFQFSRKTKALALLSLTPIGWDLAYQYPSDTLHINKLYLKDYRANVDYVPIEYEIVNIDGVKVITANDPTLFIDHRVRVTDINLFASHEILGLAHLLASNLAIPLIGGEQGAAMQRVELALYQEFAATASLLASTEKYLPKPESDFVKVQRGLTPRTYTRE